MPVQVSDYVNVGKHAEELRCTPPTGLALLPRNFESASRKEDLLYSSSVPTVRTLWREAGISETRIEKEGDNYPYEMHNAFEWIGPVIYVGASIISQHPELIDLALKVIHEYLDHFFKGIIDRKRVVLDIIVEPKSKRIHYENGPEGIRELARVVKEL